MTYTTPPNPEYEKARMENEARRQVEDTPAMQAARQAQGIKADASWQAGQAGSFFDRIKSLFSRK